MRIKVKKPLQKAKASIMENIPARVSPENKKNGESSPENRILLSPELRN